VPSRVAVGWLRQSYVTRGLFDGSWSHRFVQVMTPGLTGPRVQADRRGREYPWPAPVAVGTGRLPRPCVRHIDPAKALRQVVLVQLAHAVQMRRKRCLHSRWQYRSPILMALAFTDQNLLAGAVTVFHSATQTRQRAPAGPLEEAGHEPGDTCLSAEPRFALWSGQHGRETWRTLGTGNLLHPAQVLTEDITGQKEPRTEGLRLGRGAHMPANRQRR
jgi:hypothetical protein